MMKNCVRVNSWGFVVSALIVSIVSLSLPSVVPAASQPVPFKAQLSAHDQISVDPASCPVPPHYASTILGTGVGTYLGQFTVDLHDCFTPAGPALFVFQNGVFTLTATDGSKLQGTYSGQLVATPTTNQDAIFALHGTYQITGGTKRFQNATGSGTMAGTENILTADVAVTLTGSINF